MHQIMFSSESGIRNFACCTVFGLREGVFRLLAAEVVSVQERLLEVERLAVSGSVSLQGLPVCPLSMSLMCRGFLIRVVDLDVCGSQTLHSCGRAVVPLFFAGCEGKVARLVKRLMYRVPSLFVRLLHPACL